MLKMLKKTCTATAIIISIWLLLSYIEIISKNICGGATYNDYNIIVNAINYYCEANGMIFQKGELKMTDRKWIVYYQDEDYINKSVIFDSLDDALAFAESISHLPFELTEL